MLLVILGAKFDGRYKDIGLNECTGYAGSMHNLNFGFVHPTYRFSKIHMLQLSKIVMGEKTFPCQCELK